MENVIKFSPKSAHQDPDQFNKIAIELLADIQTRLTNEGDPLQRDEFTRVRTSIESMRQLWREYSAMLDRPVQIEVPAELARSQHEAIVKLARNAFEEGIARMMMLALTERMVCEIRRARGTD